MTYEYVPEGVCSRLFRIEIDDKGVIRHAEVVGGCHGNLQGICRLVEGRGAADVARALGGIRCGAKPTSCPDQLSRALATMVGDQVANKAEA